MAAARQRVCASAGLQCRQPTGDLTLRCRHFRKHTHRAGVFCIAPAPTVSPYRTECAETAARSPRTAVGHVTRVSALQVALCRETSTLVAVYMCDERPMSLLPPAWPDGARVRASYGTWSTGDVAWGNRSQTIVAEVSTQFRNCVQFLLRPTNALQASFWPSLLQSQESTARGSAQSHPLLPVYQDAQGSSWVLGQDLCQSHT